MAAGPVGILGVMLFVAVCTTTVIGCHPPCAALDVCVNGACVPGPWKVTGGLKFAGQQEDIVAITSRRKRAADQRCDPGYFDCADGVTCAIECDGQEQCPDGKDEELCVTGCECAIHLADRVNCQAAKPGIKKQECENLGCCWDGKWRRIYRIQCFQPGPSVLRKRSRLCSPVLDNSLRVNCAWKGSTDHDCQCRGCCCAHKRKTIWCYTPRICRVYSVLGANTASQASIINGNYTFVDGSTCAGPFGDDTAVYQHGVNTFVFLYYVQENREWLMGGALCDTFQGARKVTDDVVPDAESGVWEEHDNQAWQSSPLTITCLEYFDVD